MLLASGAYNIRIQIDTSESEHCAARGFFNFLR